MTSLILTNLTKEELEAIISNSVKQALENQTIKPNDDLITIDELSKRLNRSKTTIWQWRKEGLIPYRKIKRKIYFVWKDVVDALNKVDIQKVESLKNLSRRRSYEI